MNDNYGQKPVSGWVSVKERLPEPEEYPCWVTDGKSACESVEGYAGTGTLPKGFPSAKGRSHNWDCFITHFCPKPKQEPPPLPTPPTPELSASERCYEAFSAQYDGHDKGLMPLYPVKKAIDFALNYAAPSKGTP